MKSTLMEYGLYFVAAILAAALLAGFIEIVGDGGSLCEALRSYADNIC